MVKEQAIQSFWASFGVPAYDENTVPSGSNSPALPYITYQVVSDSFYGGSVALTASVWDRSSSWQRVTDLSRQIGEYIGVGGKVIDVDGGYAWIKRGTPFAQRMGDDIDNSVRRIVFNVAVDFLTAN